MLTITNAQAADLDDVCALLSAVGLSTDGVADKAAGFLVVREDGRLAAVAGLEDHGTAGLLRSVAVAPDRRNRRIAAGLVGALIERSRASGHEALYLFTSTAEPYFSRFGFRRIERAAVRAEVQRSSQFHSEACASSAVMVLEFGARTQPQHRRTSMDEQAIRTAVRERYARAATRGTSCCGETGTQPDVGGSCCAGAPLAFSDGRPVPDDLAGASLGCGAPVETAALQPGETVVDLGSGAGLDVFFAADRVGPGGRAIGVDMTPEMIAKAEANATRLGMTNVEFRLGEIERLPLPDACADVIISNCVINLLPDKRPAFAEAYRILRPGGRMVVSDIVSARPLPRGLVTAERWAACLGGAIPQRDYLAAIREAGFADVEVLSKSAYAGRLLYSATVRAVKPSST